MNLNEPILFSSKAGQGLIQERPIHAWCRNRLAEPGFSHATTGWGRGEKARERAYRRPENFGIGRNFLNTGLWPFAGAISLDHNQTGKTR